LTLVLTKKLSKTVSSVSGRHKAMLFRPLNSKTPDNKYPYQLKLVDYLPCYKD